VPEDGAGQVPDRHQAALPESAGREALPSTTATVGQTDSPAVSRQTEDQAVSGQTDNQAVCGQTDKQTDDNVDGEIAAGQATYMEGKIVALMVHEGWEGGGLNGLLT